MDSRWTNSVKIWGGEAGRFTGFTNCGDYYVDNVLAKAPNSAGWKRRKEHWEYDANQNCFLL